LPSRRNTSGNEDFSLKLQENQSMRFSRFLSFWSVVLCAVLLASAHFAEADPLHDVSRISHFCGQTVELADTAKEPVSYLSIVYHTVEISIIKDQLCNAFIFLRNPVIALSFQDEFFSTLQNSSTLRDWQDAFLSRMVISEETYAGNIWAKGDLLRMHLLNIQNALSQTRNQLGYVHFTASNHLFIRRGVEKALEKLGPTAQVWKADAALWYGLPAKNNLTLAGRITGSWFLSTDIEQLIAETSLARQGALSNYSFPAEEFYLFSKLEESILKNYSQVRLSSRKYMQLQDDPVLRVGDKRLHLDIPADRRAFTGDACSNMTFGIKRVSRLMTDPLRMWIKNARPDLCTDESPIIVYQQSLENGTDHQVSS